MKKSKFLGLALAMWLMGSMAFAQGLPLLTYSKNPAVVKGTIKGADNVEAMTVSYQPVVGGMPVSLPVTLNANGEYECKVDVRTTQVVTLEVKDKPAADGSRPAMMMVSAGGAMPVDKHKATVLLVPGETLTLDGDNSMMQRESKKEAWKTAGSNAAFNNDLANYSAEYAPNALYAEINGMGLTQMRGKSIADYKNKLYSLLQNGIKKVNDDKRLGKDFREYATAQYQMMYGIMLSGGERIMKYANGGQGDFTVTKEMFAEYQTMNPMKSNAALYGSLGVVALEMPGSLQSFADGKAEAPACTKELALARQLVRQIEDFRALTDEQKATLSQVLPTYDDIILAKNADLLKMIEDNKKNTTFSIQELSDTLTGPRIFQEIVARYKGKPVLVDFWATWCGPCKAAMKTVLPVKEELWGKAAFVYVTGTTSPKATWNTTIPDIHGDHFYVTQEQWQTLLDQFKAQGIPAYVVVNANGQIQKSYIGFPGVDEVRDALKRGM